MPKTPRKVATPKLDAEGNPIAKTPRKSSVKKPAVKAVKTEDGEEGTENGVSMAAEDDGEEFATPVTPASKKRVKKVSSDETPSKRIKGNEIPSCKANLSEQDRMLMEWKESGKGWKEIGLEWNRITGKPVGSSTLPNRYARLKAALVELKEGDVSLLRFAISH